MSRKRIASCEPDHRRIHSPIAFQQCHCHEWRKRGGTRLHTIARRRYERRRENLAGAGGLSIGSPTAGRSADLHGQPTAFRIGQANQAAHVVAVAQELVGAGVEVAGDARHRRRLPAALARQPDI